jgi:predicted enzyme related to lactoylglutathione lyase
MERTAEGEFCWADLVAQDLEVQTRFYEKLFGWSHEDTIVEGAPPYRTFSKDGLAVCASTPITPDMAAAGVPSMWNVYFATPDVDAALTRVTGLGGQLAMPTMEAMDAGRFGAIQDPTGAHAFVWQARTFKGTQAFEGSGMPMWVDLMSRDAPRAIDFYTAFFPTWSVERIMDEPAYWQVSVAGTPEAGIMPMPPEMPADAPSNWMLYFGTEDADASAAIAREIGGEIKVDVTQVGDFLKWAALSDPMGAVFAVMQSLRQA